MVLGTKNFTKTLDFLHFPRYHRSGRLSPFNVVTLYTQIPLGHCHVDRNTLLDVEHIRLVTLGHCPDHRSVHLSIEHFVPLDVMYMNWNTLCNVCNIGHCPVDRNTVIYTNCNWKLNWIHCRNIDGMLCDVYELKNSLTILWAVSRVLSQGRDQTLSLGIAVLCWGCLSICGVHSLVSIPACLCQRSNLSFHWFKLWELCCSLWSPCILNELVVTFVCGRSPWPMPALLDALVGALEGEGLCPPGWGLCLPRWLGLAARRMICMSRGLACPPGGVSACPVFFPFCRKGYMPICRLYYWYNWVLPVPRSFFSLSLYHRVVYLSLSFH